MVGLDVTTATRDKKQPGMYCLITNFLLANKLLFLVTSDLLFGYLQR